MVSKTGSVIQALAMGPTTSDHRAQWNSLDKATRLLLSVFPSLLVVAAIVLIVLTFAAGGTSIHINARTEHVLYTPLKKDPPQWILENVRIEKAGIDFDSLTIDDLDKSAFVPTVLKDNVNGYMQFNCGDTVVISRISDGALRVNVHSAQNVVITDRQGNELLFGNKPLAGAFTIVLNANQSAQGEVAGEVQGKSYIWPLEGRVDSGRAVGPDTTTDNGLLLEGYVEVFTNRLWGGSRYSVDAHELELGDHVLLSTSRRLDKLVESIRLAKIRQSNAPVPNTETVSYPSDSPLCIEFDDTRQSFLASFNTSPVTDKGFIHVDEQKGMNISLTSNARYVDIRRYQTAPIRLSSSFIKRLQKDRFFSFGWPLLMFLSAGYTKLVRAYVMSRPLDSGEGKVSPEQ